VHSLIDKVYKRKNLEIAWERVKANRGSGGVDGESVEQFGERLNEHLDRLHDELRADQYRPRPVKERLIQLMIRIHLRGCFESWMGTASVLLEARPSVP
jgi:retron-type reverse transcriptase